MNPSTTKYFADRGIDVEFNTLGRNTNLIEAYIASTSDLVSAEESRRSEYVKHPCYSKFYTMTKRKKKTGFEYFGNKAREFRASLCSIVNAPVSTPCIIVDHVMYGSKDYKEVLKADLATYTKPLMLYLSGGIDSELVALALLDANIPFTPIIFNWTDNSGAITNTDETDFAYKFCGEHLLTPLVKTINIEQLWESSEFRKLSADVELISSHLATYVYMIDLLAAEYPDSQHLFGGEVRYKYDYMGKGLSEPANLVKLNKVAAGFDGINYSRHGVNGNVSGLILYIQLNGTWSLTYAGTDVGQVGPYSGTWAVAPLASAYEVFIDPGWGVVVGTEPSSADLAYSSGSWQNLAGGWFCSVGAGKMATQAIGTGYGSLVGTFQIRATAHPAITQSYSISIECDA